MLWICKENLCVLLSDRSLCSGQTRDRHTERRAGHIVQTDLVAELYGAGVTACHGFIGYDAQKIL